MAGLHRRRRPVCVDPRRISTSRRSATSWTRWAIGSRPCTSGSGRSIPKNCTIVGRARTARWMEVDYVEEQDPYGAEIEFMDSLRPGDVAVHSTDHGGTNAPWGELMSTVAKMHGAAGCICDSMIRDCEKIIALGFPVFCQGIRPLDSMGRGKVMAYDVPIRCGGVLVQPGDLVFADFDGVVVVPAGLEEQVFDCAADKVGKETTSRKELLEGKTLREVYDKYGVL